MTATGAGSTARAEPPAALVARFKEALDRLWSEGGKLGLAASGGPDSMAMLLLAHAAIPGKFEVATVDHGLRAEAKDECALVMTACAARGIPCEVLQVEVGEGNVQAQARRARYLALEAWALRRGLPAIATAHHADDQAETLLMRLNRGSGLSGLAGVRERGQTPHFRAAVIRPLLSFRRAELQRVVAAVGLEVAQDPSNENERFDRVRMRKALADADWLDIDALAASAIHLSDAEDAVEHYFRHLLESCAGAGRGFARFKPPPSREMQLRLARWAIAECGGNARGGDVAALINRLRSGEGGNVGGVLATVEGDGWVFRPEPPRRTP